MAKDQLYDLEDIQERVILVAVDGSSLTDTVEDSLDELEELVHTAGAVTAAKIIQKREKIHPGHYVGKGKVEEIKEALEEYQATGIICDDELSPAQIKNLQAMLDTKVMDRTMLILDIFAARARSKEGKIQVELAQLRYRLSRLTGLGQSLSKLGGGGIGTRGPGEKKLELDRRYIRDRISELSAEVKEIQTHRQLIRERRSKSAAPVIAIVGYTNAGKSTLLNVLTGAGVLAEDKLFATLDPTTRKTPLPGGTEILVTDTVGFIRKLPHHLVKSFHSTLEELVYADILLHVIDANSSQRESHMAVVYKTLQDLKAMEKPIITVYNKMDMDVVKPLPVDDHSKHTVHISAAKEEGIQALLGIIERVLQESRKRMTVLIPYTDGGIVNQIHGQCEIVKEEHRETGVYIDLYTTEEMEGRLQKYIES